MGLIETIINCLDDSVSRADLKKLIKKCHSMALAYLRIKASSNQLYMIRGERLEDLAWDFIAELFEKDDKGRLVKLREYFDGTDLHQLSETDLTIELRKLVFTKIEDNIFRAVGEKDPSLRKIIRNLKLAVRDNDCKSCVCYKDGYIIVGEDKSENLPIMPSEFMQIRLSSRLEEKMQIPDILTEVIDVLQNQKKYQKRISLVALASVIRQTFVHFNEVKVEEKKNPKAELNLLSKDFEDFLNRSAEMIQMSTGLKYVEKGKITERELQIYMNAAKDIVRDYFLEMNGEFSQFEYLKNYIPDLQYIAFRENHRQVLEYLVKLIRSDLVDLFEEEWR